MTVYSTCTPEEIIATFGDLTIVTCPEEDTIINIERNVEEGTDND